MDYRLLIIVYLRSVIVLYTEQVKNLYRSVHNTTYPEVYFRTRCNLCSEWEDKTHQPIIWSFEKTSLVPCVRMWTCRDSFRVGYVIALSGNLAILG